MSAATMYGSRMASFSAGASSPSCLPPPPNMHASTLLIPHANSTVMEPLFGQFCNVFGRKYVMFSVIAIFMLGSGICGGANTGTMLIAGRCVQGVGSGGIIMTTSIIISDLIPLRQRGNFSAVYMAIYGVGAALGPFIGGAIVSTTTWRWVFYLNLPIGSAAFMVLFIFLKVKYNKQMSFWQKVRRIDVPGNVVLVAGTVAILYALTYGGTRYAWNSWHTLIPLILGFLGLVIFAALQATSFAAEPVMPGRLFRHRTSMLVAINSFINGGLLYWMIFFLPVYFQAVMLYSPTRAGVALLPITLLGVPGSVVASLALARWGRFKPIHVVGFAIQTLGIGLFILQWEQTTVAEWAIYQCIAALGGGFVFSTLLPAFQAPVPDKDQGTATAAWYFLRLFGHIWGVAIPAAIMNNRVDALLAAGAVSDAAARGLLANGGAYQSASAAFVKQFSPAIQVEVRYVYRLALQRVWQVATALSGTAFLLTLLEEEVTLRKTLDTEFGLKDTETGKNSSVALDTKEVLQKE